MKNSKITENITTFQLLLLIVLGLIIIGGTITTLSYNKSFGKVLAQTKEEIRPSKITVRWLTDSECPECADFQPFIDILNENQDVEVGVETVEWNSNIGLELVKNYSIAKVPTVIITGETKRKGILVDWEPMGRWQDDAFIFTSIKPPYREVDTKAVRGEFNVTYIAKTDCSECYEVTLHNTILSRLGMVPQNTNTIIADSEEGRSFIEKYNIEKLPTITLAGDLQAFPQFLQVWPQVGDVANDGTYIFRQVEVMGNYWSVIDDKLILVQQ